MKQKLEVGTMLNPECQECSKRDNCNNKKLCAYLIPPNDIKKNRSFADLHEVLSVPVKLTPEMIQKEIIKKACEINMEIDNASLIGLRK